MPARKSLIKAGAFIIEANDEGLISLARHLLLLAQEDAPSGLHRHLDDFKFLEAGYSLILSKNIDFQYGQARRPAPTQCD